MSAAPPAPALENRPVDVLMVGHAAAGHVGCHWQKAAGQLGLNWHWMEASEAYAGPVWWRRLAWRLLDRRPASLLRFERELWQRCLGHRPRVLLVSGITPPRAALLRGLRNLGIRTVNFLTDHPFNPAHRSRWFSAALREYDSVHTPRAATLEALSAAGCRRVRSLPFAYDPQAHRPPLEDEGGELPSGIGHSALFIGGADSDRAQWLRPLLDSEAPLALRGGYWQRWPEYAALAGGHADEAQMRALVAAAGVNLGLVRLANADDHSMRSYELAAIGGVLLMQDTSHHRRLFGPPGEAVWYASDPQELAMRAGELLRLPASVRQSMRERARRCVVNAANRYADRLRALLQEDSSS